MEANIHPNEGPVSSFFLAKIQRNGKTSIISDFGTTVPFGRIGSPLESSNCGGLHPGHPNFSSTSTSLHLVASSLFYSVREGGSWCWEVIKCLVSRSLWDDRGQDFWEAKSLLLMFLLCSGKCGFVCLFWSLDSQHQQKQPLKTLGFC